MAERTPIRQMGTKPSVKTMKPGDSWARNPEAAGKAPSVPEDYATPGFVTIHEKGGKVGHKASILPKHATNPFGYRTGGKVVSNDRWRK